MAASHSPKSTCPITCPLRVSGCYAKNGPINICWLKVSSGEIGLPIKEFCTEVKAKVPPGYIWRFSETGDLPGDGVNIDFKALKLLVEANRGRKGYSYSHYLPTPHNLKCLRYANDHGFVISLSANNLHEVDQLVPLGLPVVTLLPEHAPDPSYTPGGLRVKVCRAEAELQVQCVGCQLCAKSQHPIIGFRAHGHVKAVEKVYYSNTHAETQGVPV